MAKSCKGIRHIKGDTYFIDFQAGKVRKQCRINANSLKEAKAIRRERIVELRRQLPHSQTERERLDAGFDEAWQKLEADIISDGVCKKNVQRHKRIFWRIFDDFRKKRYPHITSVSQISISFIQEYKAFFINELGHNPKGGLRAELICLKSMMRRLKRLGFCGKDIIESLSELKRPPGEKKTYPEISHNKIKEILDFIRNDRPDFYGLIYFMARLGRRIGELSSIERRDVVWNGLRPVKINVRPETTKTKEMTPIDRIDDELAQVIQEAYRLGSKHKTVYLFCTKRGRKCAQGTVQKYLRKVSSKITGVEITPHYFRHRFLTECGKANVPMIDAMKIAGIKDIKVVTRHYSHTTNEGQDKVLAVTRV